MADNRQEAWASRVKGLKEALAATKGNEASQRGTQLQISVATVESAIDIAEALNGLQVAVNDAANRAVTVLGNLTTAINKATDQAALSSTEATNVARESAKLSKQLNRLTVWVISAAVLSAIAATIQAGVALWGFLHSVG